MTGAGGFTSKTALARNIPVHRCLSTGLLQCPHSMVAGFPRTSDPKEQADCSAFRSHTVSASLRSTGYTRPALIQCGRATTTGINIRKQGLLGPSWRLTTTVFLQRTCSRRRRRKEGRERKEEEWDRRKYFDFQRLRLERNNVPSSLQRLLRSTSPQQA